MSFVIFYPSCWIGLASVFVISFYGQTLRPMAIYKVTRSRVHSLALISTWITGYICIDFSHILTGCGSSSSSSAVILRNLARLCCSEGASCKFSVCALECICLGFTSCCCLCVVEGRPRKSWDCAWTSLAQDLDLQKMSH